MAKAYLMAAQYLQSENVNSRNAYFSFCLQYQQSQCPEMRKTTSEAYLYQENNMFRTVFTCF